MDGFIFDYSATDGGVIPPPVNEGGPGGEVIFNDGEVIAQDGLSIGDPTGGVGGGYSFPLPIGPNSYVLAANTLANALVWVPNAGGGGGGGDIVNGGNFGPLTMGTIDATPVNIISGGSINIGATGNPDQIHLNGSVGYQYDNITASLGTLVLNADYFFVEVSNAGTNTIALPDAATAVGRQYIVSKGFSGGTLQITTTPSDTIDGNASLTLRVLNQRIKLISNGVDKWIIL